MSRRHALAVVSLVAGFALSGPADALAAESAVGHTVKRIVVPGSLANEQRQVDVHLWYPADAQDAATRPRTVYTSALYGKPLPGEWAPLSWRITAESAREGAAFDASGGPYAPIVFSHGASNDPFDYADTLEAVARAGFIVAAPAHSGNTQDDVRIDYINALSGSRVFTCDDGLPARPVPTLNAAGFPNADCSKASVPNSMSDRVRDVSAVLDALDGWYHGDVDIQHAGVMGHSRGSVTALAVAGGSVAWGTAGANCAPAPGPADGLCWAGVKPDTRVKAIMGMAIGLPPINAGVDLAKITIPTLLVNSEKDSNTVPANTIAALGQIPAGTDKARFEVPGGVHRSFDSTYCAQLQAAGAAFDTDHDGTVDDDEASKTTRPLDRWNLGLIAASFPGNVSGKAINYCSPGTFTGPVDIRRLVAATPNAEYGCAETGCGWIPPLPILPASPTGVCLAGVIDPPCTGVDSDAVKATIIGKAVEFFTPRLYGTTPPTLTVPAGVSADATGPTGALVPFAVTATDDLDPTPTVVCTPGSGSRFAIGETPVTCVATDNGHNTSTATFTVTVRGATEQLSQLIAEVVDTTNLSPALKAQLTSALRSLVAGFDPSKPLQRKAACVTLTAFNTIVRILAPSHAAEWTADANRIRAVLAC